MKRKPWNEEDKDEVENPIDHTYLAHSCFKTNYLKWNMTPKSLLLYNSSCRHDIIWCGDLPLLNGLLVLDPHIPLHWHFMKPFADRAHISVPLSKDLKMQQLSRHKTSYVGVSTSPKTITSSLKIFYIFYILLGTELSWQLTFYPTACNNPLWWCSITIAGELVFGANLTLYLILCSERSMQCLGPQVMFRRIKKLLYLCLSVRKNWEHRLSSNGNWW